VNVAANHGFRGDELTDIRDIVVKNRNFLLEKWHENFGGE